MLQSEDHLTSCRLMAQQRAAAAGVAAAGAVPLALLCMLLLIQALLHGHVAVALACCCHKLLRAAATRRQLQPAWAMTCGLPHCCWAHHHCHSCQHLAFFKQLLPAVCRQINILSDVISDRVTCAGACTCCHLSHLACSWSGSSQQQQCAACQCCCKQPAAEHNHDKFWHDVRTFGAAAKPWAAGNYR